MSKISDVKVEASPKVFWAHFNLELACFLGQFIMKKTRNIKRSGKPEFTIRFVSHSEFLWIDKASKREGKMDFSVFWSFDNEFGSLKKFSEFFSLSIKLWSDAWVMWSYSFYSLTGCKTNLCKTHRVKHLTRNTNRHLRQKEISNSQRLTQLPDFQTVD